jgi:hypothetical protein
MDPVKDISQEAAAAGEAQKTQAAQPVDAIDELVDKWFVENVYNSPLSRDTDAFNYLRERTQRLKTALKGLKH